MAQSVSAVGVTGRFRGGRPGASKRTHLPGRPSYIGRKRRAYNETESQVDPATKNGRRYRPQRPRSASTGRLAFEIMAFERGPGGALVRAYGAWAYRLTSQTEATMTECGAIVLAGSRSGEISDTSDISGRPWVPG
jgi:hypothetical protein